MISGSVISAITRMVPPDLYSRAIVGWSMGNRMTQQLMCDALTMALFRCGFPKEVIIHSDRGSQYCSKLYQGLIQKMGLHSSMGRRATCYDNAAMESFFHSLKVELIHRERYKTRQSAKGATFEYIEIYYNRKRRHSAIGNKSRCSLSRKVLNWVTSKTGDLHRDCLPAGAGHST